MTGPIQHRRMTTVLSFSETFDANLSGILLAIYRKLDEKDIISKYTCDQSVRVTNALKMFPKQC